MRAWKMTAGLAVAALIAAFLAPRLFAAMQPIVVVEPDVIDEMRDTGIVPEALPIVPVKAVPRDVRPILPTVPAVPSIPMRAPPRHPPMPAPPRHSDSMIPEASQPILPSRPVPPEPPDRRFDGCPMCGMG